MERLTKEHNGVVIYCGTGYQWKETGDISAEMSQSSIRKVLERLKEYEDLGLEPQEIKKILQPKEPLTLDQLKNLDGLPVEFERFGWSGVGIVCITNCYMEVLTPKHGRLRLEDMGENWVAYPYIGENGGPNHA